MAWSPVWRFNARINWVGQPGDYANLIPTTPATAPIKIMSRETINVGGCDFPVFKIETRLSIDGKNANQVVKYLHAASMLTFRTIIEVPTVANQPARTIEYVATELD